MTRKKLIHFIHSKVGQFILEREKSQVMKSAVLYSIISLPFSFCGVKLVTDMHTGQNRGPFKHWNKLLSINCKSNNFHYRHVLSNFTFPAFLSFCILETQKYWIKYCLKMFKYLYTKSIWTVYFPANHLKLSVWTVLQKIKPIQLIQGMWEPDYQMFHTTLVPYYIKITALWVSFQNIPRN